MLHLHVLVAGPVNEHTEFVPQPPLDVTQLLMGGHDLLSEPSEYPVLHEHVFVPAPVYWQL